MTIDQPPTTGNRVVDEACAAVADLSDVPLGDHAARLAEAHELVGSALQHTPLVALPDHR